MKMRSLGPKSTALLVAGLLAFSGLIVPAPTAVQAQQLTAGVNGSWSSEVDLGLGGRLNWNIPDVDLEGVASVDVYAPDPGDFGDFWEINANLFYHFHLPDTRSVLPYAGGGLNIAKVDVGPRDDTELGLNLGGGIKFPTENLTPFVEGRGVLSDFDHFVLSFGVLFGNTGYR